MDPRPQAQAPPVEVLAAWGLTAPVPLTGGQGTAYAAGDVVLKPVAADDEAVWTAETLCRLPPAADVRVVEPVRARDGRWVVSGWTAWKRLSGADDVRRWRDVVAVGERFHALTAGVPWHPAMRADHHWGVADRWAWGEEHLDVPPPFVDLAGRLQALRRPLDLPCQLVHGDLLGNVLFDQNAAPAVIDLSPYWRPTGYATAIVLVDSVAWFDAQPSALSSLAGAEAVQLLVRAALFRLGAAIGLRAEAPHLLMSELPIYARLTSAIEAL